ncbi:hypothetical protein RFI_19165 [Reticulomyxa filosa]|uniref:Ankyrin repeat protein n=1 Tax=Reticulomyxa filosa TaxID=46433 RepID=X6MWA7_RETFI|nr:hypothetical protein RFI_19165 [Reticulomyxa filosa]|eukprot:ETO18124.1 hypothetical protein RFI_19165 [Reticulomyxa filosa]
MLKLLRENVRDETRWQKLLQCSENDAECTPLMTAVFFQANLTLENVEQLVPKKVTSSFWEKKCNERVHSKTLLHLLFFQSLPNVRSRVQIFKKLIPKESWERLIVTTDDFNQIPLMEALARSPEINEEIISWLLPSKIDDSLWKQRTFINRVSTDLDGMNLLHLAVQNPRIYVLGTLECLRTRIPTNVWSELLKMKDVFDETPLDVAKRLNQPNEVLVELEK